MWSQTYGDECEEKRELSSTDQPTAPPSNATIDTARQETAGDMMTREDESVSLKTPLSPVVQNVAPVFNPVSFDMETRSDEIAADVPLPGDQLQGWITEVAFFTVSSGARQVRQRKEIKMSQLTHAERREFLKSMDTEWQTLLKNQAARVLSLEETAQARARWPDRAMDTRWVRTWKPDESKPSGRRAKARLIIGFFFKTLTSLASSHILRHFSRDGFATVLQSVCSHGHKLQFGDVQQAFNTGDPIKKEQPLFVRMPPDGVPGSCSGQLMDWPMARGNGGTVSLLQPEVWVLRRTSWNRVFWC